MRAFVLRSVSENAEVELAEVPEPEPGSGQILLKNQYAALNWADTQIRRGLYGNLPNLPVVMGAEFAGVVERTGPGVTEFSVGDRVAAIGQYYCGGFAEYAAVPQERAIKLPQAISTAQGAAFPVTSLTAYHLLFSAFSLGPEHSILIHAIGGALGSALTQLAKDLGARVIGTTFSPHKIPLAREAGADLVINRSQSDFVQEATEATNGRGVDLIIDSLGGETLWQSFDALANFGTLINLGEAEGWPQGEVRKLRDLLHGRSAAFRCYDLEAAEPGSARWRKGVDYILERLADDRLRVAIAKEFAFEDCVAMFHALESRQFLGKLLLKIS